MIQRIFIKIGIAYRSGRNQMSEEFYASLIESMAFVFHYIHGRGVHARLRKANSPQRKLFFRFATILPLATQGSLVGLE